MADSAMTGLQCVRRACVIARGGQWCDEHRSDRVDCRDHHPRPAEGWRDYNPMTRDE